MDKLFKNLRIFIEIVLQCSLFVTAFTVIGFEPLQYTKWEYWLCFWPCIPVVIFYFLRQKNLVNRSFYILHGIVFVLMVLAGRTDNEKFFIAILMLFIIGFSMQAKYRSTRPDKERPAYYLAAVMIYAYISGKVYGSDYVIMTAIVLLFVYVLLSVLHNNIFRMGLVYSENSKTANFPGRQLNKVNSFIMIITLVLMTLAMLVVFGIGKGHFWWLTDIIIVIGRIFIYLFLWFLELLGKLQPKASSDKKEVFEEGEDILTYVTGNSDGNFEKIMNAFIIFAGLMVVIISLYFVFKYLHYYMRKKEAVKEGSDTIEFIKNKDSYDFRKKTLRSKEILKSNNEKFRQRYKKTVLTRIKKEKMSAPNNAFMPSDITKGYITSEDSKSELITEIYEKARYSDEEISGEEMKSLDNRHLGSV